VGTKSALDDIPSTVAAETPAVSRLPNDEWRALVVRLRRAGRTHDAQLDRRAARSSGVDHLAERGDEQAFGQIAIAAEDREGACGRGEVVCGGDSCGIVHGSRLAAAGYVVFGTPM
jgi:hypothetical protein